MAQITEYKTYTKAEIIESSQIINEDALENILLVAGFVPFIGEVADIILIIRYVYQKRYIEAGLMLVALIPTVGDVVVKPFLVAGRTAKVFTNPAKFTTWVNSSSKLKLVYQKILKLFNDSRLGKLIGQVGKITPRGGAALAAARATHINLAGKIVAGQKKGIGNYIKQSSREKSLAKFQAKHGGKDPSTYLSGWWNVVYKGNLSRRRAVGKLLLANNLLNSLGILSIEDLENKMSNPEDAEKLVNDPKFQEFHDQVNQTENNNYTNEPQQPPKEEQSLVSKLTGVGGGVIALNTLKMFAKAFA